MKKRNKIISVIFPDSSVNTILPRRGSENIMKYKKGDIILDKGELFVEYPENNMKNGCKIKIGDGVTKYSDLGYTVNPEQFASKTLVDNIIAKLDKVEQMIDAQDKAKNDAKAELAKLIIQTDKDINAIDETKRDWTKGCLYGLLQAYKITYGESFDENLWRG